MMKDFRFFKGFVEKEIISQHEYNRRRDMMAQERYQREYYEQMRKLDEIIEENRRINIKKKLTIWSKLKTFFQKNLLSLINGNKRKISRRNNRTNLT